jgi:hypothetical protein
VNDYQWKIILYSTIILLTTAGCIAILLTAYYVNTNIHYDSLSMYKDSCYVYGDNEKFSEICYDYAKNELINNTRVIK